MQSLQAACVKSLKTTPEIRRSHVHFFITVLYISLFSLFSLSYAP